MFFNKHLFDRMHAPLREALHDREKNFQRKGRAVLPPFLTAHFQPVFFLHYSSAPAQLFSIREGLWVDHNGRYIAPLMNSLSLWLPQGTVILWGMRQSSCHVHSRWGRLLTLFSYRYKKAIFPEDDRTNLSFCFRCLMFLVYQETRLGVFTHFGMGSRDRQCLLLSQSTGLVLLHHLQSCSTPSTKVVLTGTISAIKESFVSYLDTNSCLRSSLGRISNCLQGHSILSSCGHLSHSEGTYHFLLHVIALLVCFFLS